ncbi:MAG TPA: GNAT family N-acetyltransferase [Anaerolineae bacterium]|nr:GNAT family N-acetyltransferase [Anaerolineae bacterium]
MLPAERDSRRPGTFWVINLDSPKLPELTPRLPASFGRVEPEAAEALAQAMGQRDPTLVLERFDASRRCYAAYVEGRIAAYGWVSFDEEWIGEIHLRIRLAPGEAYIWDCATLPAYRRYRLYTTLLAHIVNQLRDERLRRAWIGTDMDNIASQRGIALAGFRPVADLVVERVLALRRAWIRGRPGVPEQLVDAVRRALLGDRDRVWLAAFAGRAESRV